MPISRRHLPTVPAGLIVSRIEVEPDRIAIFAAIRSTSALCPSCGLPSRRVHSRYRRVLADLPWQGRPASIVVEVRRLRCATETCRQQVFAERIDDIAIARARRTVRLSDIQHHIGRGMGGEAGARLAERLGMAVSAATLLRMVRGSLRPEHAGVRVLGVDDWAWRRGCRYGTILCDLERRCVVDLLADRSADSLATWLERHPGVEIVSRDRGGGYAEGARRGAPQAIQVADRWHLFANCSAAFLDVVKRLRPTITAARKEIGATNVSLPSGRSPMTAAERRSFLVWQRRMSQCTEARQLAADGIGIREVSRRLAVARNTVRRWVRGTDPEMRPPRRRSLDPYQVLLDRLWSQGCCNGAELWRRLRQAGFPGALRVVTEWANRQRLDDKRPHSRPDAKLSARKIARLLMADPATLHEGEHRLAERILATAPALAKAREIAKRFMTILRDKNVDALDAWSADAIASHMASFANGIRQDIDAVRHAMMLPWSNGQVEGQIHRLKLLKRQMYGRAKLDLLRARLMQAA
jgi:transposase